MKSICVIWFLLELIRYTYSLQYISFDGSKEKSKQAQYYMSVDTGTNKTPTDGLTRTQRCLWKFLKFGPLGECGTCCSDSNYKEGNGNNYNLRNKFLTTFQPCRPLCLWQPFKQLFGQLNCVKHEGINYGSENSNDFSKPQSYNIKPYSGNSINTLSNYDSDVTPVPLYEIQTELPHVKPDYKLDSSPFSVDTSKPASELETITYTNAEVPKAYQQPREKATQIIYRPIIFASQFQDVKKEVRGLDTVSYTQSPVPSFIYSPANPLVSSISTVCNIITPSLPHPLRSPIVPSIDEGPSKYILHSSNYIPIEYYASKKQLSSFTHPILLTNDDQPYRDCPELFADYKRQISTFISSSN